MSVARRSRAEAATGDLRGPVGDRPAAAVRAESRRRSAEGPRSAGFRRFRGREIAPALRHISHNGPFFGNDGFVLVSFMLSRESMCACASRFCASVQIL